MNQWSNRDRLTFNGIALMPMARIIRRISKWTRTMKKKLQFFYYYCHFGVLNTQYWIALFVDIWALWMKTYNVLVWFVFLRWTFHILYSNMKWSFISTKPKQNKHTQAHTRSSVCKILKLKKRWNLQKEHTNYKCVYGHGLINFFLFLFCFIYLSLLFWWFV